MHQPSLSFAVHISVGNFHKSTKGLEHIIPGTKTRGNLVGVYNPGGNGRGGSHGHMTACCYAACGTEASDNADKGPQQRRGGGGEILLNIDVTQVHCSREEGARGTDGRGGCRTNRLASGQGNVTGFYPPTKISSTEMKIMEKN